MFRQFFSGDDLVDADFAFGVFAGEMIFRLLEAGVPAEAAFGLEIRIHTILGDLLIGARLLHHLRGELADVPHEDFTVELGVLHLAELVLPLAGELGRTQGFDADLADLVDE